MCIPKIIHYCWFGNKPLPEVERKCIESWKVFFPNYEFMFWNENTFDIGETNFIKQAYETGHYAFVSDYVRTKVLFEYGGIYLDTDVEFLKSFEQYLESNNSILGFETQSKIGTALMAFSPKHEVLKSFFNFYLNNNFINKNGDVNTIANVTILTDILLKAGLIPDGRAQVVDDIEIYPREHFYPKKISDNEFKISTETVAVHKCSNSWMTVRERKRGNNKIWVNIMRPLLRAFRNLGLEALGESKIRKIEIKLRNVLK
jgi:mannosyltransferase OCH1-like enzyme